MPSSHGKISVVIPVYESEKSIRILVTHLMEVLAALDREFEIVLVDDCSPDGSWMVLKELKSQFGTPLKIIRLLRNSGQHNAILCGFSAARGEVMVTMDDDLQHPPEEIPKLVAAIDSGYDLAIGAYDLKKHNRIRNAAGGMIDSLLRRIFRLPKDFQLTSFRAVRKVVVENVVRMGGAFPYVTSMLLSHASRYTNVEVRHEPRRFGETKYNFQRSLPLAANLLLSYSPYPVYAIALGSAASFAFALVYTTLTIYEKFVQGIDVPGWASLVSIMSFSNAVILFCLMILSLYLLRFNQQLTGTRVAFTMSEIHE